MSSKYTHQLLGWMYLSVDRQVSTHKKLEPTKNKQKGFVMTLCCLVTSHVSISRKVLECEIRQQTCITLHIVYTSLLASEELFTRSPCQKGM